jgi:hypothetical protein
MPYKNSTLSGGEVAGEARRFTGAKVVMAAHLWRARAPLAQLEGVAELSDT